MVNASVLSGLVPLFIIIILLGGTLFLVKKYSNKFGKKFNKQIDLKIISSLMVVPKKYITIVKVQNELLLLGVSDQSVNLLKELGSVENPSNQTSNNIENKVNKTDRFNTSESDFAQILKKNLGIK